MAADGESAAAGSDALELLLAVQDLDTAITQLQHRRANLPERGRLVEVQGRLAHLERRAAEAEASRGELAGRQAAIEQQIATTTSRRQAIEQRLYAARGAAARDLQAMDEEIRHLTERQSELEDEELELMVAQEPLDAELSAASVERDRLEAESADLAGALASAESVVDEEIGRQRTARAAAAEGVPLALRERYEALRTRMGGTGAARLVGNRCSGCHLELPSMEVERIRHLPPGTVATCDQCGRILVPAPATPPAAGAPAAP